MAPATPRVREITGTGADEKVVARPVAVLLLDSTTGKQLRRVEGFPDNLPIRALAFRPTGRQLVTAAGFLSDTIPTVNWPKPAKDAPGLRVIPLAARADPKPEPAAWKETKVLELTGWLGGSVTYSADGKTLFVGGTNGNVQAYDAATFKQLWELKGESRFAAVA